MCYTSWGKGTFVEACHTIQVAWDSRNFERCAPLPRDTTKCLWMMVMPLLFTMVCPRENGAPTGLRRPSLLMKVTMSHGHNSFPCSAFTMSQQSFACVPRKAPLEFVTPPCYGFLLRSLVLRCFCGTHGSTLMFDLLGTAM